MSPPVAAYPAGYRVLEIALLIFILAGIAGMVVWATQNALRWADRRPAEPTPPAPTPAPEPQLAAPPAATAPLVAPAATSAPDTGATVHAAEATAVPIVAPRIPGSRLPADTFSPIATRLQASREMLRAESLIEQTLQTLPVDRWEWQRQVLLDGHVLPFLIFGETGVFAVWGAIGPVLWEEPARIRARAAYLEQLLPDYPGEVHVAFCRALHHGDLQPRWWSHERGVGAWVMGLSSLTEWLQHFGTDNGVGVGDLNRLRELRAAVVKPGPPPRHPTLIPDL
jgi:hypothetical protein